MPELPPRTSADLAALVRLYFAIAIWRRGPQELPAVGILLPLTIAAYVLLSAAVGALLPGLHPGWLLQVAADALFVASWYWLLLAIARRRERYLQTATALFGLQTVLAAPSMAVIWLMQRVDQQASLRVPVYIAALALAIWTLVAIGHILRAALERPLALCLILALLQMVMEELVLLRIFGPGS
ncbi:MAG TPA: hypothetical protein VHN17_10660 [Steroidobacteraceae bacterium]|jgi:hypothetical protein|nr:hypothetical protein [Steroidobacteraceae bacterium]